MADRKPRHFQAQKYQPNFDSAVIAEKAQAMGENGVNQACEKLAKRIAEFGPSYYWGRASGRHKGPVCVAGGIGTKVEHCPTCGSGSYRWFADSGKHRCKRCSTEWK